MTERRSGRRTAVILLFVVYLILLVWLVLWKLHAPFIGREDMREIKLIPFAAGDGYGSSSPFEVAGNLAVFVPFGLYLGILLPRWSWWQVGAAATAVSLVFETIQYVTAVGASDITDVISNTAGGLLGFGLLVLARRQLRRDAMPILSGLLTLATVLALVVTAMVVVSYPRLGALTIHRESVSCPCSVPTPAGP
jgi:glycopeptide antibiotics resistance protein